MEYNVKQYAIIYCRWKQLCSLLHFNWDQTRMGENQLQLHSAGILMLFEWIVANSLGVHCSAVVKCDENERRSAYMSLSMFKAIISWRNDFEWKILPKEREREREKYVWKWLCVSVHKLLGSKNNYPSFFIYVGCWFFHINFSLFYISLFILCHKIKLLWNNALKNQFHFEQLVIEMSWLTDRQSFSLACDGCEIPEKCAIATKASDVIMCLIKKSIQMHIFCSKIRDHYMVKLARQSARWKTHQKGNLIYSVVVSWFWLVCLYNSYIPCG